MTVRLDKLPCERCGRHAWRYTRHGRSVTRFWGRDARWYWPGVTSNGRLDVEFLQLCPHHALSELGMAAYI